MTQLALTDLPGLRRAGTPAGITSVCSAHPLVLRAALQTGRDTGQTVLMEATCNQVNHLGGYTGMTPVDFANRVRELAQEEGCPEDRIILGGDHLGPNPWRDLPTADAMKNACDMVAAYVAAGFQKIHLDASMGCAGEPRALNDEATAIRAAELAATAEAAAKAGNLPPPLYVIGTEVPPPGGADHILDTVAPTTADAARATFDIHARVFAQAGLDAAFDRVIGLVVQPGVEFGNHNVVTYDATKARDLTKVLDDLPGLLFEAHSTDYQGQKPLTELVRDGFAILKVGPELTFVLREALYALDLIASDLREDYGARPLYETMEALMRDQPGHWTGHYPEDESARALRHYSLSDRIRYYWTTPRANAAVETLFAALRGTALPDPLVWQHFPAAAWATGAAADPEAIVIRRVRDVLDTYNAACAQSEGPQ